MFPWFTIAKYGIPFIIGLLIGGGSMWQIQQWRYQGDRVKLETCISANIENQKSINTLDKQIKKNNETCEKRLKNKQKTMNNIKSIDNLRGNDEKDNSTPDDILDALNGMHKPRKD